MADSRAEREHPIQAAIVRFDADVDRAFDRWRGNPVADRIFYTASELGDWSMIWHLFATARGVRRDGDLAGTLRIVTGLAIESGLVNGPVKSMFRRARPVSDVPRPHRLRKPRTSSFPSGHASAATVFTVLASDGDSWWPVYVGAAAIVASSRAYVRIHHASDVVGGVATGVVLGGLLRAWWPSDQATPRWPRRR